ncbi:dienelactone hydrolase family protein [uncultured Victivallis sp.]|uniref:dienelactone hydrolase family protein n=1 Tax=uncultured Victivallis sp. TaxID=354118 RepID=UPI002584CE9E|nr:dienelactone hydrolase family protein [uncultured Victivallis sp.]
MNPVFTYCLALGCFAGISAGAWTLDFEEPLLKAGPSGKVYVNPTGNFRYDGGGENARSGKGALALAGDGRLTMDYREAEAGKRYRLSAFAKGSGTAQAELLWLGEQHKVLRADRSSLPLTGKYARINVTGEAPAGVKHVYLVFYPAKGGEMLLDDVSMEALAVETDPVLLDFETPVRKAGGIGPHFVNPTGTFRYDDSGEQARNGIGAMQLTGDGRITIDFKEPVTESRYRLSAFVKGSGTAAAKVEWRDGNRIIGSETRSLKLGEAYRRLSLSSTAPAGANHAYLFFFPEKGGSMYIDNIDMKPVAAEKDPALLDFEEPLTGAGNVGGCYVNPTGSFRYDDSGQQAYRGVGAMQLTGNGRVTVDFRKITPGRTYRLSAQMKGKGTGLVQMQWLGKLARPQLDTRSMALDGGEYRLIQVTATAPAGAEHVYLHLFTTGDGDIYLDDVRFTELENDPDAPAITADFTGKQQRFSIYRKGEPVVLRIHSDRIAADDTLEWKLCDFLNREVARGSSAVTPGQLAGGVELTLPPPAAAGSYFLYLKLAESGATVPFKGSRLPGYVCFGVLPEIEPLQLADSAESRFGGQGTNFIESGRFMEGDPYRPFYPTVGMKWVYDSRSPAALEPTPGAFQPLDAAAYRRKEPPYTARNGMMEIHDLHGVPRHLLKLPAYVDKEGKWNNVQAQAWPLGDAAGYTAAVEKIARDLKARREVFFPQRKHNYFQLHWEPDWHWQGNDDEFIEYYRAAREGLRAADPDARLLGANYGVIARGADKMETLFKKGLGNYLDGILIHLYFLPVREEPEKAGLHRDCRRVRQLADRYIAPGAPVINTEWGVDYRGGEVRDLTHELLMNHVSRFTRGHLIALGEGFDATWFFYTTDYCSFDSSGGEQGYGISFNTSSYIKDHKFGAASLEPKPTMMAAAAMTRLLEGTKSLGRLDQLDPAVFAYSFRRGDANLIAVWSPEGERELSLPAGVPELAVYDIMGNVRTVKTKDGVLTLTIGRFPQYILGVADAVLPTALRSAESVFAVSRRAVAPGEALAGVFRAAAPPRLELRRAGRVQPVSERLPEQLATGCYELAALDAAGRPLESMLLDVTGLAELGELREGLDGAGRLEFTVPVANLSAREQRFTLRAFYDGREFAAAEIAVPGKRTVEAKLPAGKLEYDGLRLKTLKVEASTSAGKQAQRERFFGALLPAVMAAPEIDGLQQDWPPQFFSRDFGGGALTYQQKRHRGNADFSARYALGVDRERLFLTVRVQDDVALPTVNPAQPWREDSLIIALGRDSDGNGEFRNCRRLSFTRNADGSVLAQEIFGSPPKGVVPLPAGTLDAAIRRDENGKTTVYELALPLTLFGAKPDESLGLGITLHDVDTPEEVRQDLHREMSLAGGVPLFMGDVKFATLLLPERRDGNPAAAIWDMERLFQVPPHRPAGFPESEVPGLQALTYDGWPLPDGRPGRVFAYCGIPAGTPPAGGFPAVLLVHGGGGTAFARYAKQYLERGYAVLAPDLYGKRPLAPDGAERVPLAGGSDADWQLRSVADVISAHSLLRSLPNVNPEKTGLVGVSWGGVFGSIVSTLDDRFRLIVPVYGCGFWAAGDASSDFGRGRRSCWYDPGRFLPFAKVPLYWVIGADDGSFGLGSWLKSTETAPATRSRLLLPKQSHSHVGFELPSVLRAVDAGLNGAPPPPEVGAMTLTDGVVSAPLLSPAAGNLRAELYCSEDPAETPQQKRNYRSVKAEIAGNVIRAALPETARCWFLNVYDGERTGATAPNFGSREP